MGLSIGIIFTCLFIYFLGGKKLKKRVPLISTYQAFLDSLSEGTATSSGRFFHYNNHCFACKANISNSSNYRCCLCGWFICNTPGCYSCSCGKHKLFLSYFDSDDEIRQKMYAIVKERMSSIKSFSDYFDAVCAAYEEARGQVMIEKTGFDHKGYDKEGYDRNGYGRDGFNRDGIDSRGFNREGYNKNGFDRGGYDSEGYNMHGFDRYGVNRVGISVSGYDRDGYDKDGYNREGYDREGYNRDGLNKEGFSREGLTGEEARMENKRKKLVPDRYGMVVCPECSSIVLYSRKECSQCLFKF